jgi:hypothetical protein
MHEQSCLAASFWGYGMLSKYVEKRGFCEKKRLFKLFFVPLHPKRLISGKAELLFKHIYSNMPYSYK